MQTKTVQDIHDLNTRISSIKHAITLMEHKYNLIHNKELNEDTFFPVFPEIYSKYSPSYDIANLNDFK